MEWSDVIKTAIHLRGLYPNNRRCPPWPEVPPETFATVQRVAEKTFGPFEKVAL